MDTLDRKILSVLQRDASLTVTDVAKIVGISSTPCWRRIQKMRDDGVITGSVALLDGRKINAGITAFVSVVTASHSGEWLKRFSEVVNELPEITELYRLSGNVDYLLKVIVPDIAAYDKFQKRLTERIDIQSSSPRFAVEQIKSTTELPLEYLRIK